MSTEVKKFNGFCWTEFKEEQLWLEDLARQGLLLKNRDIVFSVFEESEPSQRRYRIFDKIKKEEKELIESSGWTCMEYRRRKAVFYTDDPETLDIITDDQGFRAHFGRLVLSGLWHIFFCITVSIYYILEVYSIGNTEWQYVNGEFVASFEPSLSGLLTDLRYSLTDTMFFLLVLLCWGWSALKDVRCIIRYKTGSLEEINSYRTCYLLNKIRWCVCIFLFVSLFTILAYGSSR